MVYCTRILATAFLAGPSLASLVAAPKDIPAIKTKDKEPGDGRATLKVVPTPNYRFSGPLSMMKTYLKYQMPDTNIPAGIKAAAADIMKRDQAQLPAEPYGGDHSFVTPVSIGTPPQTFQLQLNTGVADLWVFSSFLPSLQTQRHALYDPHKSTTAAIKVNLTWNIADWDEAASGIVYTDKVSLGGITFDKQTIGVATYLTSGIYDQPDCDGILGLAFSNMNRVEPQPQKTLMDNVKDNLDAPLFTADLRRSMPGTYNFGFIDGEAYRGNITYTNVSTVHGYWEWNSTGFAIGKGNFVPKPIHSFYTDTSTTISYLPMDIVAAYWQAVDNAYFSQYAHAFIFPCGTKLPSFTFGVENARIEVIGKLLDFGPWADGSPDCYGGIQSNRGLPFSIFGVSFLNSAFVVFESKGDQPRIGFASKY